MRIRHSLSAFATILAITLLVPPTATPQGTDDQEVMRYVLTDAGLTQYARATRSLAALPASASGCEDDDSAATSISEMVAKLDAWPGAKAAIESSGMTSREYIVFSMSILQNGLAAWVLSQPGGSLPAGVSKANVDFINRHEAELKTLEGALSGACDDIADADAEE
jgi:hypothetical protein